MKKGISLPRSKEFCHKRIIKLEEINEALSSAMNELADSTQRALMKKDKERMEMCQKCTRGIR